jgi:hypothetical protein
MVAGSNPHPAVVLPPTTFPTEFRVEVRQHYKLVGNAMTQSLPVFDSRFHYREISAPYNPERSDANSFQPEDHSQGHRSPELALRSD